MDTGSVYMTPCTLSQLILVCNRLTIYCSSIMDDITMNMYDLIIEHTEYNNM